MKVAFITAIYGNYELTCKPFVKQSIESDFFCFTDNEKIISNGWKIITEPYHLINNRPINKDFINDINNNRHSFNIAKYYKCSFYEIPILHEYDIVVWLDGTIEITNPLTSFIIQQNLISNDIFTIRHEMRNDQLVNEVIASRNFYRYSSSNWNGQDQPIQNVYNQYKKYIEYGYKDIGVFLTCLVGFKMKKYIVKDKEEINKNVIKFLNLWYRQILEFTTQDQISFPYCLWKEKQSIKFFKCVNNEQWGTNPHVKHYFYTKHEHGL